MKTATIHLNSVLLITPACEALAHAIADAIRTAYPEKAPNAEAHAAIVREIAESGASLFSLAHKEVDCGGAFTVTLYGVGVRRPTEVYPVARVQLVYTAD